ncbi:S-adenosyl-L-methionine-dependent methyltransferase [Kalaharituber pfeilii]|nr:S-adenosyl-L-methionine-dependent methyltransferase [Kalaharituber pfeilii]
MEDTFTLSSSVLDYQYENGRRYHAFKQGSYACPNDQQQNDQLDIFHHVYSLLLGGELYMAPIGTNPERILDVGTGTGIWAVDMADKFPESQIIGTDLSPIQPNWVPSNIMFEIDDCEAEWTYPEDYFDFIHVRCLFGSISDWPKLIAQAYRALKPGGWIELVESKLPYDCDDGTMGSTSAIYRWTVLITEAAAAAGKPLTIYPYLQQWLLEAGFVRVDEKAFKTPVGGSWCQTATEREIGRWNAVNVMEGMEGFSLALLTRVLKWHPIEVQALLGTVRTEILEQKVHSYFMTYFIIGQKPL